MIKSIRSYNDLLQERERLQSLLQIQKQVIKNDIYELKQEFVPVKSALTFAGKFLSRDGHNWVLNAGANKIIDLVVKKLLLSRSGWLTRLIIPFFVKNYSSHFIAENKKNIFRKIFSLFKKKHESNGQEKIYEE